jgi:hypothetical protein
VTVIGMERMILMMVMRGDLYDCVRPLSSNYGVGFAFAWLWWIDWAWIGNEIAPE